MPTVICIPGASQSEHSFRDVTPLWPLGVRPAFHNIAGLTGEVDLTGYSWQYEIDRLDSRVTTIDDDVYLLGISGGATLALGYVAQHPDRIAGIGLIEPAWSYLPLSRAECEYYEELNRVMNLPPAEQRMAFLRLLVLPDVEIPGRSPVLDNPYEQARSAADTPLAVVTRAFQNHHVSPAAFAAFSRPVYLAIGGRSNPMWRAQSAQITLALPQSVIERYPQRHHLDSPHHSEAAHLVRALLAAWHLEASG